MKQKPRGLARYIWLARDRWGDAILRLKTNQDLRSLKDAQAHERAWMLVSGKTKTRH